MTDIIAGDPAPTNPTTVEPSERDQLMFMMLHGGAASEAIAAWRVDRLVAEVREQARAKVLAEAADRMAELLKDTPEYGPWVADQLRRMAGGAR